MKFSYLDIMRIRLLYEWQFKSLPDQIVKLANDKKKILEDEAKHRAVQDARVAQLQQKFEEITTEEVKDDGIPRDFHAKYALIYANQFFEKLREIDPQMGDLKWTKNDLMNARPTVDMLGVPRKNVYELIDCSYDQV